MMRALKFFIIGVALFIAGTVQSQVSVKVNLPAPPLWGPVGYTDVNYYYLPDVEAFYDIQSSMFIYYDNGAWIHRTYLPTRYRDYDLYGGYKVVMRDYHGNAPYNHFNEYRTRYGKGYRPHEQRTIGERPGRGNPGGNNHREGNYENRRGGRDIDNNARRGNENRNSRGNDNNRNGNRGHGEGKGDGNGKRR